MSENPYQATETDSTPSIPALPQQRSSAPKVLGIIHFVYAGLGLIAGLSGVASPALTKLTTKPIIDAAQKVGKSSAEYQAAVQEIARLSLMNGVVQIVLAVLLAIAGFHLIKFRLKGAKLSKLWATIRIPAAIIFAFLSVGPTQKMMIAQSELMSAGDNPMVKLMDTIGSASVIMNVVFLSIYPIVTLAFMTRKKVVSALD